jgi:hypothetical protein
VGGRNSVSLRDAVLQLVEIRKRWRNNGSTIEFSKAEGAVFQEFRRTNNDWETAWPTAQLAAHKIIR